MDSLNDYFEYAMDLATPQRDELIKRLLREDPPMAARLQQALGSLVTNPDFLCQAQPDPRPNDEPDTVHHVTVAVGDIKRAVEWYQQTFRAKLLEHGADLARFAFGSFELHLVHVKDQPAGFTIVRPDVATMGPSKRRPDGVRGLHLVDPWGNAIEVVDRPPSS